MNTQTKKEKWCKILITRRKYSNLITVVSQFCYLVTQLSWCQEFVHHFKCVACIRFNYSFLWVCLSFDLCCVTCLSFEACLFERNVLQTWLQDSTILFPLAFSLLMTILIVIQSSEDVMMELEDVSPPLHSLRNRHKRFTGSNITISEAEMRSLPNLYLDNDDGQACQRHRNLINNSSAGVYATQLPPARLPKYSYASRTARHHNASMRPYSSRGYNPHHRSRPRVLQTLRKSAKFVFIPKIKDINIVDRYSRIIFPSSFVVFNICYWSFYFFQWSYCSFHFF